MLDFLFFSDLNFYHSQTNFVDFFKPKKFFLIMVIMDKQEGLRSCYRKKLLFYGKKIITSSKLQFVLRIFLLVSFNSDVNNFYMLKGAIN